MRRVSADVVRGTIARHLLGVAAATRTLGDVTLHPHQVLGVERVKRLLDEHRGALLADDVGLGKTFIALALARDAGHALVLAPAALRDSWLAAARRSGATIDFHSLEQLSRGALPARTSSLVIVDEAHHLRSVRTRRFALATALCGRAAVLLLTATPIQNSLADLRAVLSLFLGERAHALDAESLARFVICRREGDITEAAVALPVVQPPRWLDDVADADCLDRLLALPPPLPPADGHAGGILLTYTLARQWASSRAALRAALYRRLARASAMDDALQAGRRPTQSELASWCYAEGVQQLAFPELTAAVVTPDAALLRTSVLEHAAAVRSLLGWLAQSPDPDEKRATLLRQLLAAHDGERVVAFSEHADTVASLFRLLSPHVRVAMLTHTGGRVVGGPLRRRDLIDRFQPGASRRIAPSERIDLLLTTDVLSEGVSLHDASVVVHLDLSWNPARLDQRVGRVRRIGASRDRVSVYAFRPPAPAERLLALEGRLRVKLAASVRMLGLAGAILPGLGPADAPDTIGTDGSGHERISRSLRPWLSGGTSDTPVIGAARSSARGFVACVRRRGETSLLVGNGGAPTEAADTVERLLGCAGGEDAAVSPHDALRAENEILHWLERRGTHEVIDLAALRVARSRRAVLHRVEGIARRIPRHVQSRLAPLVHAARSAAAATLSAGAERVLDELARAPMRDDAWLQAVGEFASLHARAPAKADGEILALLLLNPE